MGSMCAQLFDEAFRGAFPHVTRWFLTLAHQPAFAAVMGEVTLAKERMQHAPAAKKPADKAPAAAKPKESKPESKAQVKPGACGGPAPGRLVPPYKQHHAMQGAGLLLRTRLQAPATPEPEEEKAAPKPKDPLALLPPSRMVLDSWKRLYSNTPAARFKEVCVAGLWNGADIPNSPTSEAWLSHPTATYALPACMHAPMPAAASVNPARTALCESMVRRVCSREAQKWLASAQHFEGFDPEGFSIWFCDYKYPEENTVNYIVMNKVCSCPAHCIGAPHLLLPAWTIAGEGSQPCALALACRWAASCSASTTSASTPLRCCPS